ncbi:MAG: penicillin-binding protein [Treponema sp.]
MELNISKGRFIFFIICLSIFTTLLLGQFAKYMLFKELKPKPAKIITKRGNIYDRNKRILAVQTTLYNLSANKDLIVDEVECAKIISPIIGISEDQFVEKIRKASSNFVYIKKRISENEKEAILSAIELNELEGLSIDPIFNRTYPENTLASTVVGFLGDDGLGLTGIEYSLQKVLSPPPNSEGYDGVGYDVYLSIDANIQYMMEKTASNVMQETNCEGLMFLAVEAKTGEVLGYVSAPSASLSNFTSSKQEERFDRPANFIYEPGSVFKIFSIASFLELGSTHDGEEYFCDGHFDFENTRRGEKVHPITCLHRHGNVSPRDIIRLSCNDGIAQIANQTDSSAFYKMLVAFGFGSQTGINLPGETIGILNTPKYWSVRSKHTIAMGQEIGVSALQIVQAATAITNDGKLLKLSLISKVEDKDGDVVYSHSPTVIRRVISKEHADLVLDYMHSASKQGGTGWRASINGVPIAVKTGTAQMANKNGLGYSDTDFVASCIGIFPSDDPKIILYLACVRPVGKTYGELIAAPAISQVSNEIIDYLGMARENAQTVEHSGKVVITQTEEDVQIMEIMPNLIGKSKRQLLNALKEKKYKIILNGDGYIYQQTPKAGTKLEQGETIELYLR